MVIRCQCECMVRQLSILISSSKIVQQQLNSQKDKMQKLMKATHSIIKTFDFFPNKQFIRYEHENQYKTATGGTLSLTIIIIFTILFLNNGLKTLRKQLINSSSYTQYDSNPTPIDISFQDKTFMFAIFIGGVNLTDPSIRWFDVTATQNYVTNAFNLVNQTNIPLVPCTDDHVSITQQIRQSFKKYKNYSMLCPQLNSSLHLEGKPTSSIYSYLDIRVKKCNATLYKNCAPDALIQKMQQVMKQWLFSIPIMTTVINPSNSEYISYIIEDRNFFTFTTKQYGIIGKGYFEGYNIDTDESIFPMQNHNIQTGGLVSDLFTSNQFQILNTSQYYLDLTIAKSPLQTNYTRSFQKIDQYLSYVGGLIGIVLLLFVIFNFYTEAAYSLSLAAKIFTYKEKDVQFHRFNFLYFLLIKIMALLNFFKLKFSCEIIDQFISCKDQVQKQIDITFILKRIKYLQNAISIILDQHQYQTLHLIKKQQLSNVVYNRLLYQQQAQAPQIDEKDNNEVANQYTEQHSRETPSPLQLPSQNLAVQDKSEVMEKNQNHDQYHQNNSKMTVLLQKLVKQARGGDPISFKVAQKIGMNLIDNKSKKTGKSQFFQVKVENYELAQNKSSC